MSTINERFRKLRELKGMSQEEFASGAHRTRSEIKNIEYNKTSPKEEVIQSICAAYNVNENWLRTGEGEPFVQLSRDAQITRFVGEAMRGESPTDQQRFLNALLGATAEELHAIAQFAVRLAAEYEEEKKGNR